MMWLLVAALSLWCSQANAQQAQCRTDPVGSTGSNCASESFVTSTGATAEAGAIAAAGTVKSIIAGTGISISPASPCTVNCTITNSAVAPVTVVSVKKQIFTSSGTYTPSTGMLYAIVECVGPGGGGGASVGATGSARVGAGGSSGGYSRILLNAAAIGVSKAVVIGAHGAGGVAGANNGADGSAATTLGATLCVANAGKGGKFSNATQVPNAPAVASAGTGDLAIAGNPGSAGLLVASATGFFWSGQGGIGPFGGAPPQPVLAAATANNGAAATGYGSGGSGGYAYDVAGNAAGGDGADGVVFVTEFNSQ